MIGFYWLFVREVVFDVIVIVIVIVHASMGSTENILNPNKVIIVKISKDLVLPHVKWLEKKNG
jgi:hypothetical protein